MDLCDLVKCPLSGATMHDPVYALDGFVYERSHIVAWLQSNPASPLTGECMDCHSLIPAKTIYLAIQRLRQDDAELMPYIKAVECPPSCAKPYAKTPRSMTIPARAIPLVIGTRGKTIRTIEKATDTKITIAQGNDPCVLTFAGQHSNVLTAQASIANIVEQMNNWKQHS